MEKVKNILLATAEVLGLQEAILYLNGESTNDEDAKTLLRCYNLVENELALDYFPLYSEDELTSPTGRIFYAQFLNDVIRVFQVYDEQGNAVDFQLFPAYLQTVPGKVRIKYSYKPLEKTFTGSSEYTIDVSLQMMMYGVAAAYTLGVGLYEESAVWDRKFKDAIAVTYKQQESIRLRSRRWV